jgi:vWA-MoxR associated protein middle region 0/vWA-MoxR associated protein C-terminal domain
MGTSRELGFSAATFLGAAASAVLLEQAMVRLLARSARLEKPSARRALLRHLERSVPALPRPDPLEAAADELARIVHGCAQDDQTGEKTDSLTRAVLAVTGDSEMVSQLRLLSDLGLARARLPLAELSALYALLRKCAVDVHDVARSALAPLPPRLPDYCTDAWNVTLHLMRRNARPDGLPPFLAFLEYVAASLTDPAALQRAQELQQWNLAYAQARGLEEPLGACRASARLAAGHTGPRAEHRIMFVLLPDGLDEEYCTLRVWHQHDQMLKDDDVRVRQSELQRAVRHRLAQWTSQKTSRQILVEFWLGLSLLNLPVVRWCMPEDRQGWETGMRVVVRSFNLRPDDTGPWREHWVGLIGQNPTARPALCPAKQATAALRPGRPLILAEPPDRKAGREQLLEALRQGVAAVMWDHSNTDVQQFRAYAEMLFDEAPLAQLPKRLAEVQTARDGSPQAQALQGAVLMWDDPDRDLPKLSPLTSPDEVSAR